MSHSVISAFTEFAYLFAFLGFWVLRFNPSQHLSPTQLPAHSITSGICERNGRVKMRKLKYCGKDSLIGKAKALHINKANQCIHSSLPVGRQVFSHPQKSRTLSCVMGLRKTNTITPKVIPLPLSPMSFMY